MKLKSLGLKMLITFCERSEHQIFPKKIEKNKKMSCKML